MSRVTPNNQVHLPNSLSRGIICHEQGQLTAAAYYFFQSCKEDKHPLAFYFLGMCLRHGFGVSKNEHESFHCFQNSIAHLIERLPIIFSRTGMILKQPIPNLIFDLTIENDSLVSKDGTSLPLQDSSNELFNTVDIFNDYAANETLKVGVEIEIIKNIFPLSIFELGNSLLNGWGVKKSRTLAEKMYLIGAKLCDVDCQLALIHLYETASKKKKRKKDLVYWYRQAAKSGWTGYYSSWIWEKKYDDVELQGPKVLLGDETQDLEITLEVIQKYKEYIQQSDAPQTSCYCSRGLFTSKG